jgi:hypothetical protein
LKFLPLNPLPDNYSRLDIITTEFLIIAYLFVFWINILQNILNTRPLKTYEVVVAKAIQSGPKMSIPASKPEKNVSLW